MKIYVVVSDGGDGSYHPHFIKDENVLKVLQQAADDGHMDYENGLGVDGDGFHYSTLEVPDGEVTGGSWLTMDDVIETSWFQEYMKAP